MKSQVLVTIERVGGVGVDEPQMGCSKYVWALLTT